MLHVLVIVIKIHQSIHQVVEYAIVIHNVRFILIAVLITLITAYLKISRFHLAKEGESVTKLTLSP